MRANEEMEDRRKGKKKRREKKKTHKIQPPNQFPLIVQLRIGRPVGESLQSLPDLVVGKDIEESIAYFPLSEQRDKLSRKPALRLGRSALHEEHHWRGADEFSKAVVDVFRNAFFSSFSAGFSGGSVSSEAWTGGGLFGREVEDPDTTVLFNEGFQQRRVCTRDLLEDSFTLQEDEVGHSGDVVLFGGRGVGFVFCIDGEVGCGVRKISGDCFEESVL